MRLSFFKLFVWYGAPHKVLCLLVNWSKAFSLGVVWRTEGAIRGVKVMGALSIKSVQTRFLIVNVAVNVLLSVPLT